MQLRALQKRAALHALKILGGFWLCRMLTRRRLRILCYHGISVGDQNEFAPILFMRPDTFRRRMALLRNLNVRVVSLSYAIALLRGNEVRHGETVITIDDGWKSTLNLGIPILREFGLSACLYATTHYCERPVDVFNVAVRYLLWKTSLREVVLAGLHPALDGAYRVKADTEAVALHWIGAAERNLTWQQRQILLVDLCGALGLDAKVELRDERFRLMTEQDIERCHHFDIDVQLHTHRHSLSSTSFEEVAREVNENRLVLCRAKRTDCTHFCYPSGSYAKHHERWLTLLGVDSAATCDIGLNRFGSSLYFLKRHLDRDDASDIEFEAEVCGVMEIARWLRGRFARMPQIAMAQPDAG